MIGRPLSRSARAWLWALLVLVVGASFVIGMDDGTALAASAPDPGAVSDLDPGDDIDDEGEPAGAGRSGVLLLLAAIALMIALGSPLFVIIGVIATMCFLLFGDGYTELGACGTLESKSTELCKFDDVPPKIAALTTQPVLLAIPFFVVSGAIMRPSS